MPYAITPLCQRQGDCLQVCPVDAIHFVDDDPDWPTYYVNPDPDEGCIECGSCEAVCPNGASFHQDELPAEHTGSAEKNAAFYRDGPGRDLI
jgi:ferredoxin--NADP+ reductase